MQTNSYHSALNIYTNIYCHSSNKENKNVQNSNKRVDYIVDIYKYYKYCYTSCYGEMKSSSSGVDGQLFDFYRTCIFSKQGSEKQGLNKCLTFYSIG